MTENMKDSGIEWIGEIPEEWDISKLKDLFTFGKGLSITKENLVDEGISVISYGQIHSKNNNGVKISESLIRYVDKKYLLKNFDSLVHQSDFIFADTSEDLDGCGNCIYVNSEMILFAGYHTIILNAINAKDNRYLAYLFKTDVWRSQIRSKVYGIKVYSITQKILKEANIIIPPFFEQQAIADFLDEKVGQVDDILADLNKQVDILNQYKKSLITETVTKGLNPDAEMKDSGIDWIGEINQLASITKLKYIVEIKDGTHDTPDYVEVAEDTVPLITSKFLNYEKNEIMYDIAHHISHRDYVLINRRSDVEYYDIIMPMIGTIGNPVIVKEKRPFSIKNVALFKTSKSVCLAKYLYYQMKSNVIEAQFDLLIRGGVQSFVSLNILGDLRVVETDINQQKEIVDYLDKKCSQIDGLMEDKKKQIEKMENYKKSLIYEYVTGKKRVKGV